MSYIQGRFCVTIIVILYIQILFTSGAKRTTNTCECGKITNGIRIVRRIVGGKLSKPHDYPWLALILYSNVATCGGSIINNYYILTAAHCVQPYKPAHMSVVLGVHDRIQMNEGTERSYKVVKAILHPGHLSRSEYDENDIALLKVDREIKYENYIKSICLPPKGEDFTQKVAIVAGWGRKKDEGYSSRFLHDTTVEVLSNEQCVFSKIGNLYAKLPDQVICAYQRNTDACDGDSGSPLVTKMSHNTMVQIGLVAFGKVCGSRSSPGAYTKITHYLDWIEKTTKDAVYCREVNDDAPRRGLNNNTNGVE